MIMKKAPVSQAAVKPRNVDSIITTLPQLWCDFNALGVSGSPGDRCFYSFDADILKQLTDAGTSRVFLFDYDYGENEPHDLVVGCEATLELFEGKWRARPNEEAWCRGRLIGFPFENVLGTRA